MLKLMKSYTNAPPFTLLYVNLSIFKIKINNDYMLEMSYSWIY